MLEIRRNVEEARFGFHCLLSFSPTPMIINGIIVFSKDVEIKKEGNKKRLTTNALAFVSFFLLVASSLLYQSTKHTLTHVHKRSPKNREFYTTCEM